MASATTPMETASTGSTSETRPPAGREASDIAAAIKAAERAGVRSWLRVKAGTSMKAGAPVKTRRPVESAAMPEITVMEPLVTELMAMRDKGVVVEERSAAVPVISPVAPAPPKSSEEADAKSNSKAKADAVPKNPRLGIPAWIGDDRGPV